MTINAFKLMNFYFYISNTFKKRLDSLDKKTTRIDRKKPAISCIKFLI